MLRFTLQPSYKEEAQLCAFTEQIEDLIKAGRFETALAEYLLGENALPDYIVAFSHDIKTTTIPKRGVLESYSDDNEEGSSLVSGALGVAKRKAQMMINDPKGASVLFRSLRNKLEDTYEKKLRAKAEDHGFLATVIHTIKRAMYWLMNKFKDLRDDFHDYMADRPAGSSRTKRDYLWLRNQGERYLAQNSDWYLNSEY